MENTLIMKGVVYRFMAIVSVVVVAMMVITSHREKNSAGLDSLKKACNLARHSWKSS